MGPPEGLQCKADKAVWLCDLPVLYKVAGAFKSGFCTLKWYRKFGKSLARQRWTSFQDNTHNIQNSSPWGAGQSTRRGCIGPRLSLLSTIFLSSSTTDSSNVRQNSATKPQNTLQGLMASKTSTYAVPGDQNTLMASSLSRFDVANEWRDIAALLVWYLSWY